VLRHSGDSLTATVSASYPTCGKWRALPPGMNTEVLGDTFYCVMNSWDEGQASCGAPQEIILAADQESSDSSDEEQTRAKSRAGGGGRSNARAGGKRRRAD
jgi:hypothetical protein